MIAAQLSLVTDIGRDPFCPLNSHARINNRTIMPFPRTKQSLGRPAKKRSADRYRKSGVFEFVFPNRSRGRNHQHAPNVPGVRGSEA